MVTVVACESPGGCVESAGGSGAAHDETAHRRIGRVGGVGGASGGDRRRRRRRGRQLRRRDLCLPVDAVTVTVRQRERGRTRCW